MSRFGSTATFYYAPGDTLVSGTYLYLGADSMPNYPFEAFTESDRQTHVSKTGRRYSYQNYALNGFTFNFANLKESTRGSLKAMYDSNPIFSFVTNSNTWGTYKFLDSSWKDQEIAFELYDCSFSMIENI